MQSHSPRVRSQGAARLLSYAAVIALFVAISPRANAAPDVSTTGDANPPIPATSSPVDLTGTRLLLGGTSGGVTGLTGALNVSGGGNLTVAQIAAGFGGLGTGTATIDGAGSIVTIARGVSPFGGLDIGSWGTGSMSVTGGAHVVCTVSDCQFNDIGGAAGSTGTLTINGAGSGVTGMGSLSIGQANTSVGYGTPGGTTTGTLLVQSGGVLGTVGPSTISAGAFGTQANGNEHTVGNVTIDGTNSKWLVTEDPTGPNQARLNMAATPNATATLTVSNGGQVSVTGGTIPSVIIVGDGGAATLTIASGGQVSAADMIIGNQTTGSGTVTVGGAGSTLSIGNGLTVGNQSTLANSLTINAGGTVTVSGNNGGGLAIAQNTGSQGSVTVNGGTLNLSATSSGIGVGNGGIGMLTIQGGGQVTVSSNAGVGLGGSLGSTGTVVVDGSGSQLNITGTNSFLGIGNAGNGSMTVQNGGQVNAVNAGVSNGGNGTLLIQAGGQVSVTSMGVGNQATGFGTITVGGASSSLTVSGPFTVGQQSAGANALTINTGGTVTLTGATPGGLAIAQNTGSQGAVTVNGGTLNLAAATFGIGVGNGGTGTLTVQNGGQVTVAGNSGVSIGGSPGSSGTVLVNGAQLNLTGQQSNLNVGNAGTGTMTISNGSLVNTANVGVGNQSTGNGTLTVDTGSTLTAKQLNVANGGTGVGVVNIVGTGAGNPSQTIVNLTGPSGPTDQRNPLGVGWGTGTITVSNGAIVNGGITGGVPNANCVSNLCNNFIGNAAGSTALMTLTGPGTTVNLAGGFFVGSAAVFTQASSGFDFGTPGATTHATVQVLNGATLNTYQSTVSQGPGGAVPTGTEHTIATMNVDGVGSTWSVTRNVVTGSQAQINIATANNSTGTVNVTGGGQLVITGSRTNPLTDGTIPVIQISGNSNTSSGTLNISGANSAVVFNGDSGAINVGRNLGTGQVNITNGGQVSGNGPNGLVFMAVGRGGGNGTLTVDGTGSGLTLSGVGGVNTTLDNLGGLLQIGRDTGGVGAVSVTNGGSIHISDGGQAATAGGTQIVIARDAGSTGSLTVSGATSTVVVAQTGAGTSNPGIIVGRAGNGTMTVTNGAQVAVNGTTTERQFIVGNAAGGNGTLTVSNGGAVSASWFTVGNNGGTGTTTINNASLNIDGVTINSTNGNITGGGIRVGRGTGSIGTLNLVNGAQVTINTATTTPEVYIGGTGVATGGNGAIAMSGGSSISFTGPGATPRVVIGHSGTGLLTMIQGSTLNLNADGSVILGATATGSGRLEMTSGSSISAGSFFGIAHNGTTSTGGTGTVVLQDSSITATTITLGSGGCLAGNGTLHGNVVMDGATTIGACDTTLHVSTTNVGGEGILNPGRSPGRLVIDGGFQFISGTIVLEVQSDGLGGFITDQLVFSSGSTLDLTGLNVVFAFLGNTDPNAFEASGLWDLDTFFKTNSNVGSGFAPAGDTSISTLLAPNETLDDLFAQSTYEAHAASYVITDFTFSPDAGVTSLDAVPSGGTVPEPSTAMLVMLGALLLLVVSQRRPARAGARVARSGPRVRSS